MTQPKVKDMYFISGLFFFQKYIAQKCFFSVFLIKAMQKYIGWYKIDKIITLTCQTVPPLQPHAVFVNSATLAIRLQPFIPQTTLRQVRQNGNRIGEGLKSWKSFYSVLKRF